MIFANTSGFNISQSNASDLVTVTKSAPKNTPVTPSMVNRDFANGDRMDSLAGEKFIEEESSRTGSQAETSGGGIGRRLRLDEYRPFLLHLLLRLKTDDECDDDDDAWFDALLAAAAAVVVVNIFPDDDDDDDDLTPKRPPRSSREEEEDKEDKEIAFDDTQSRSSKRRIKRISSRRERLSRVFER